MDAIKYVAYADGFRKIVQVLYADDSELSLMDVSERMSIDKASASMLLHILEFNFQLVKTVIVDGYKIRYRKLSQFIK